MNYSGGSRKRHVEETEIETPCEENTPTSTNNTSEQQDDEMQYAMDLLEKTRMEDEELFGVIMRKNKEIMTFLEKDIIEDIQDIKQLDDLFNEVEQIDKGFLFWCVNKGIKSAIILHKNLEIVHFLIVKRGYKLKNKKVHKQLLYDYFESLSNINFLDCAEDEVRMYASILHMLINYGEVDVNDPKDGILNSPLHLCVIYRQLQFLMILLKSGKVEVSPRNKYDDTPLDMALESLSRGENIEINEEIVKLLMLSGAEANSMKYLLEEMMI